jgi:hypothetical protein
MIIYMQDFSPIFLKLENTDFKKIQKPGSREPGIQNDALLLPYYSPTVHPKIVRGIDNFTQQARI